jgi:spore germination cell wall hydrolase CwlJ-like protein
MKTKYLKMSIAIVLSIFGISLVCNVRNLYIEQTRHVKAAEYATVYSIPTPTVTPTATPLKDSIKITYTGGTYKLSERKSNPTHIVPKIDETQIRQIMIHSFGIEGGDNPTEQDPKKVTEKPAKHMHKVKKPSYPDIGICIAKKVVNIRKNPLESSNVLGKLSRNCAAAVLNRKNGWYYIKSGNVKGFVKTGYINTHVSDRELLDRYGKIYLKVITRGAAVREKKNVNSDRLAALYKNDTCSVIAMQGNWLKVKVANKNLFGYVKKQYANLIVDFKDAISMQEVQDQINRKQIESICTTTNITYRKAMPYNANDLKLLACLVHAEAGGQTYEGKLAVANIVVNRILSSKYSGSMKGVIYQPGQFSVVRNGSLARLLRNFCLFSSGSYLSSMKAAKAALKGMNNMGSRLYFHAYKVAIQKGYQSKPNCVKVDDQLYW